MFFSVTSPLRYLLRNSNRTGKFFLALLGASMKMQCRYEWWCLPLIIALGRFYLNKSTNQQEQSKTTKKKKSHTGFTVVCSLFIFLRRGLIAPTSLELEL